MRVLFDGIEWNNGSKIVTPDGKKRLPNKAIIENAVSYQEAENALFMIFNKEVKRVRSRRVVRPVENDKELLIVDVLADYDSIPLWGRAKRNG